MVAYSKKRTVNKPVRNLDTGEVFPSVADAAAHYWVCPGSIRTAICRQGRCAGYRWAYLDGRAKAETFPVRNLDTGEVFPSLRAAARAVGVKGNAAISEAIERDGRCAGYRWAYAYLGDGNEIHG